MPWKRNLIRVNLMLIACLALTACGEPNMGQLARATPSATPSVMMQATPSPNTPTVIARAAPSPGVASPSAPVSPEATGQAPPATAGWPERALPKLTAALTHSGLRGDLVQLPDTPYVYGINVPNPPFESPTPEPLPRTGRLARIDLASQQVTFGPAVSADATLITIGASVYLFSPQAMTANGAPDGPYSLRAIDGISLGTPVSLRPLSGGGIVYATSNPQLPNHGLWLATASQNGPSRLWLVDSQTGSIIQHLTFVGDITSIAPSPDGTRLYLARFTQPHFPATPSTTPGPRIFGNASSSFQVVPVGGGYFPPYFFVDELDAATGRLIVESGQEVLAGEGGVTAINSGVWVSAAAGMNSGEMYLLRQTDLKRVAFAPAYVPKSLDRDNEAAPKQIAWTGSIFWLESWAGLSCVDPTSGVELAGMTFPDHGGQITGQLITVAAWNGWVYALIDNATSGVEPLVAFKLPAACG